MPKSYIADYLTELERDPDSRPRSRRAAGLRERRKQLERAATLVSSVDHVAGGFNPSFHASKHERAWILSYLGPFYDDNVILDVLRQVKGGKEATVYCCAGHPATGLELIAAKVYRPTMFRALRNDAVYRQGRAVLGSDGKEVRDARGLRALRQKTRFGQEERQTSWRVTEYATLDRLYRAGAAVPKPLAHSDNTILMEYLGEAGQAAPILNQITLEPEEAPRVFEHLLRNVELMLAQGVIHADLSAHNILYWAGEATIIDFPQAVSPFENPEALMLLTRDLARLGQYFARYGLPLDAPRVAHNLWVRHVLTDEVEPFPLD